MKLNSFINPLSAILLLAALPLSFAAAEEPAAPAEQKPNTELVQPHYLPPRPWVQPTHACKPESIRAATPTRDFIDNKDGTVTHRRTGLVWMRCPLGQNWDGKSCAGEAGTYNWKKALQAAPALNAGKGYAGRKDWRLPNIKELDTIIETQCIEPSINTEIFPDTPPWRFWSSTPSTSHEYGYAWYVNFSDSYVDEGRTWAVFEGDEEPDDEDGRFCYHVRLVRGGQPLDAFDAGPPKQPHGKKK